MPKTPRELLAETVGEYPPSRYVFPAPAVSPGVGLSGIFAEIGAGIGSVLAKKREYLEDLRRKGQELVLKEMEWEEARKRALIGQGINPETGKPFVDKDLRWEKAGDVLLGLDPKTGEKVKEYPIGRGPSQVFVHRREGAGWGTTRAPTMPIGYAAYSKMFLDQAFKDGENRLWGTYGLRGTIPMMDFARLRPIIQWGLEGKIGKDEMVWRINNMARGMIFSRLSPKARQSPDIDDWKTPIVLGEKIKIQPKDYYNILTTEALRVYEEAKNRRDVGAMWPSGQVVPDEQQQMEAPSLSPEEIKALLEAGYLPPDEGQ